MAHLIDQGEREIDQQLQQISQMPLESLAGWRIPSSVTVLS
jgi:hypothetical protein